MNSSKVPISKYLFNVYTHCTIIRLNINTLSLYVWYKYSGRIKPYRYYSWFIYAVHRHELTVQNNTHCKHMNKRIFWLQTLSLKEKRNTNCTLVVKWTRMKHNKGIKIW